MLQALTSVSAGNLHAAGRAIYYLLTSARARVATGYSRDSICRANGCFTRQLNNMIAWHFNNNTYRHFPFRRNDRISIGQKWRENCVRECKRANSRQKVGERRGTMMRVDNLSRVYIATITGVASTGCWNASIMMFRAHAIIHSRSLIALHFLSIRHRRLLFRRCA